MTFAILLLVAYIGLFLHWYKKRVRKQTLHSFKRYLLAHRNETKKSLISIFTAIIALYQVGDVELSSQTLANAFGIGYALDSALNKVPEDD